nr:MAG TPA: hypothetical protein [Caudoviricetes sp.]
MLLLPELLSSGSNVILKNDLFSVIYYLNSIDIRN